MRDDILKMKEAIRLLNEVNEPFIDAFWNTLGSGKLANTQCSIGAIPQKLSKIIYELKLIESVLDKNRLV